MTDPLEPLPSPHDSFDAMVWAKSFVAHVERNPSIPSDVGTMLAWFAGALMRGYDEAKAAERRACVTNRDVEARFAEQGRQSNDVEARWAAYHATDTESLPIAPI